MGFYGVYSQFKDLNFAAAFNSVSAASVLGSLEKDSLDAGDFLGLLSPAAGSLLENIARKASRLTRNYFGNALQLYAPLYLSNYCDNSCLYCGFSMDNRIKRRKLSLAQVEKEARHISSTGIKHVLILTGESRSMSPLEYLRDCIRILKKYFPSVSIEIYPLTADEYAQTVSWGVDGLAIYQETYDEKLYAKLHERGPKKDYFFRLDAPERGAVSGMRSVSVGALLGLQDWRKDVFYLGLHAQYLRDNFPAVEIGLSLPRIRPQAGSFRPALPVEDKDLVQIILALRIFLPRAAISLSTRESPKLRDDLLPLGITRISAGSSTSVGGYTLEIADKNSSQFQIQDERSVAQIKELLETKGYQPVFKDWLDM